MTYMSNVKWGTPLPICLRQIKENYNDISSFSRAIEKNEKSAFNVVTEQIAVLVSYKITDQIKWVCFHCTIAVSHVHMDCCKFITLV